jgi:hypothetical protein
VNPSPKRNQNIFYNELAPKISVLKDIFQNIRSHGYLNYIPDVKKITKRKELKF